MHKTTDAQLGRPQSRGFRATRGTFPGFHFEWDVAYNILPSITVQAVMVQLGVLLNVTFQKSF